MARLRTLSIEGYRSISEQIVIRLPEKQPVVLIGENNAGKSNIIRAIDILFGELWPGSKGTEDHDHWDRNPGNKICIDAQITSTVNKAGYNPSESLIGFRYSSTSNKDQPNYVGILESGKEHQYIKKELRSELSSIVVDADRNLSYQLSYASKWTLLSKVTRSFHNQLVSDSERIKKLKGLYDSIKETFLSVPEFKTFSDNMSKIAGQIISNMSYGLKLDFSAYDPSNYFRTLRVQPSEGDIARNFEELGTGQQQILALAFAHAYSKSFFGGDILLIIEEPESHLHPLAQKWLAKTIHQMAKDGLQIIITTHSPHFINLEFIEGVYLVRRDSGSTYVVSKSASDLYQYCIKTGANESKTKEETVVPFYHNHATSHILNGFFAKKIILAEGLTEELSLPIYFDRLGLDLTQEGIEIIGVQGKGNLAKWWRLFTLYNIPTFVFFDNDNKHDDQGLHRTDYLKAIGIQHEQISDLLKKSDWNVSTNFCVFGFDFEKTMRASFPDYLETETIKKELLGNSSKHIIARETARSISLMSCVGWEKFSELKTMIIDLK
jgi:putative ATP-dependent endonuclease of OLD family